MILSMGDFFFTSPSTCKRVGETLLVTRPMLVVVCVDTVLPWCICCVLCQRDYSRVRVVGHAGRGRRRRSGPRRGIFGRLHLDALTPRFALAAPRSGASRRSRAVDMLSRIEASCHRVRRLYVSGGPA